MNIFQLIKKLLTAPERDYNWKCINCDTIFDGSQPALFIKHQIQEKHYDCSKTPK